jgi:hypothetical protein
MYKLKKLIHYIFNPLDLFERLKKLYILQNKYDSVKIHNKRFKYFYDLNKLEEYKTSGKLLSIKTFNHKFCKNKYLLNSHKSVRKQAVEIGSGSGWMANYLSNIFKKVVAIEPSQYGHKLSTQLFKDKKNIFWINLLAEDALKTIKYLNKTFFITNHVLSHLTNNSVEKICVEINSKKVPVGSILSFGELWTKDKNICKFTNTARSIRWWKENLSCWNLNFHGPKINSKSKDIFKGFHGYKVI